MTHENQVPPEKQIPVFSAPLTEEAEGTEKLSTPSLSPLPAGTAVPYTVVYTPSPSTLAIRETAKLNKSPLMLALTFLASYLYAEVMLRGTMSGVAIPLYLTAFYLVVIWYLSGKKEAFSRSGLLLLIPVDLLSVSYALIDSRMANFVTTLVLLVLIPIQLTVMAGVGKPNHMVILRDAFTVTVKRPLCNLGSTFRIFSRDKKEKKKASTFIWILIGLLCSLPVILIFLALFSSGDAIFRTGLTRIVSWMDIDFLTLAFNLLMALLITLFVAPLFLSLRAAQPSEAKEKNPRGSLPQALILSFLSGILLIQAVFVAIQFSFLFSGAGASLLPEGYTYASYVHEGFAQIVTAGLLTALIIAVVWRLCRKDEQGVLPPGVRISLTVLGLLDFALCASAYYRMFLYIQTYSLSVLRLSACWLMALVLLLILGILFKIWLPRLKLFTWLLATVVGMTLLLNGMNIDRMVAKYNVDHYIQSGFTYQLDVSYFGTLSPAALPELYRLRDHPDSNEHLSDDERWYLSYAISGMEERISSRSWRNHIFFPPA